MFRNPPVLVSRPEVYFSIKTAHFEQDLLMMLCSVDQDIGLLPLVLILSQKRPPSLFLESPKTIHRKCDQVQVLCRNVHTGPRQGQGPGTIVSYCASAICCSSRSWSRAAWIRHDWSWLLPTDGRVSPHGMFCSIKNIFAVLSIHIKNAC